MDLDIESAIGCLQQQQSISLDTRAVYIQLLSKPNLRSSDDTLIALQDRANNFLQSKREVLLILGDSGAGKSTFGMRLEHKLWKEYNPGGSIPLFIDLKTIDSLEKDLILQHLEDEGYFSDQQLEYLRQYREFILICDGYDECHRWFNLHTKNQFNKPRQWKAKLIINCRTQYIGPNYRNYFEPEVKTTGNENFSHTSDLFEEAVIVPFKVTQIKEYVETFTRVRGAPEYSSDEPRWTTEQYMASLESIRHLMELAQNPFMLKMILDVLPKIAKTTTKMTRVELYDKFVDLHFESEQQRLSRQHSGGSMDIGTLSAFTSFQNSELIDIVPEPSIIHFLAERAQQNDSFMGQLLDIVHMSKLEKTVRQAASNSITVLVRSGVRFNGTDFQGIRISGADLSHGQFDSAQLQKADMTGVRLKRTWLRQADLSEATLANVRFGESPYCNIPGLSSVAITPDGNTLVVGLNTGDVQVYDTLDFQLRFAFQGHTTYPGRFQSSYKRGYFQQHLACGVRWP
ncbi:hypothetical protein EMPS_07375 [Entomortierella parvispora]|uniref:NACHT domain-containing protein n=1 Tax=Entomortierella parvispora TaxID=205924 RepID=A0A9P3HEU1_9FUNG|nr:hypothetical protein EMPS_07375 [Entomortierella parvispora]